MQEPNQLLRQGREIQTLGGCSYSLFTEFVHNFDTLQAGNDYWPGVIWRFDSPCGICYTQSRSECYNNCINRRWDELESITAATNCSRGQCSRTETKYAGIIGWRIWRVNLTTINCSAPIPEYTRDESSYLIKTPIWYIQVTAISRATHRFPPGFCKRRSLTELNRGRSSLISRGSWYISVRIASYVLTKKSSKTGFCLCRSKSFKCGCISNVWSPKRYSFSWSAILNLKVE